MVSRKRSGKQTSRGGEGKKLASKTSFASYVDNKLVLLSIVTIAVGIFWNSTDVGPSSNKLQNLLKAVKTTAFCSDSIEVGGRLIKSKRYIQQGARIIDIPRYMQIWDLDAFKDPFVREHLFQARHKLSNHRFDPRAFFAAYLALQMRNGDRKSAVLEAYFEFLPTFDDFASHHPVLRDPKELANSLGGTSFVYKLTRRRREEMLSEYEGFVAASPEFQTLVSKQDYLMVRLNVVSRSFTTGPMAESEVLDGTTTKEDLELYKRELGYEVKSGCTAMLPVIDALNHHPSSNTDFKFNARTQAFFLSATVPIPANSELFDSYGQRVDPWLFASYGFVNSDGSGRAGVALAAHELHHDTVNVPSNSMSTSVGTSKTEFRSLQRQDLLQYLQYDDGYEKCTSTQNNMDAMELKSLKLDLLEYIANNVDKWSPTMPPRNPSALPPKSITEALPRSIPAFDSKRIQLDIEPGLTQIWSTCRLLGLTTSDYNGQAKNILAELRRRLHTREIDKFQMVPGGEGLEFRAHVWLHRLVSLALDKFGTTAREEGERILKLHDQDQAGSLEWMEAQVRLGELQTLELLIKKTKHYMENNHSAMKDTKDFIVRDEVCPLELSKPALSH